MTTSTAASSGRRGCRLTRPSGDGSEVRGRIGRRLTLPALPALLALLALQAAPGIALATPSLGPWEPLFQGIDLARGTNTPGGGMPNHHIVFVARVDLQDPDIHLFSSPRIDDYVNGVRETGGYTVSDFLVKHRLQLAVNAGLFNPQEYYLRAGTPMDISGLSVCEGVVVSTQDSASDSATITFNARNEPEVVPDNWPSVPTTGIHTAVSGSYPLVVGGVNVGDAPRPGSGFIHQANPRTAMGVSADRRYLFVVIIDGRQPGYSSGATDSETGEWLLLLGAENGINLDGGGSTTLVMEDSTGQPVRLNRSSAVADSGRERTVGSHFGIFARPVRGFINDLVAIPDDTTAVIQWSTTAPASGLVRYGTTADLALATPLLSDLSTGHAVALAGLTPGTPYYYAAVSAEAGGTEHVSPTRALITSNYVSTTAVLVVTNVWKYATADLGGIAWASPGYDDTAWESGPGLLWVDSRGGARTGVEPASTRMPTDPGSGGYPYPTYYFRTHFPYAGGAGASLEFTSYLDDGAVFYLNGVEIHRLRMEEAPAPITYEALAAGFGCDGDATCPEPFTVTGESAGRLVAGDNVLAVEVHNYNARSPDTTFGLSLAISEPVVRRPSIEILRLDGRVSLNWVGGGFLLQQAADATGPWTDVPGPVVNGPYEVLVGVGPGYFRLRR